MLPTSIDNLEGVDLHRLSLLFTASLFSTCAPIILELAIEAMDEVQSAQPAQKDGKRIYNQKELNDLVEYLYNQRAVAPGGNFTDGDFAGAAKHVAEKNPNRLVRSGAQARRQYGGVCYRISRLFNVYSHIFM